MTSHPIRSHASLNSVRIKVSGWFEAEATGWGIVVVPVVLLALLVVSGLLGR